MKRRNIRYPHSITVETVTEAMTDWLKANDVAPYCANINGRHYAQIVDEDGVSRLEYEPGTEAVSFWRKDAAVAFEREFVR